MPTNRRIKLVKALKRRSAFPFTSTRMKQRVSIRSHSGGIPSRRGCGGSGGCVHVRKHLATQHEFAGGGWKARPDVDLGALLAIRLLGTSA